MICFIYIVISRNTKYNVPLLWTAFILPVMESNSNEIEVIWCWVDFAFFPLASWRFQSDKWPLLRIPLICGMILTIVLCTRKPRFEGHDKKCPSGYLFLWKRKVLGFSGLLRGGKKLQLQKSSNMLIWGWGEINQNCYFWGFFP